MSVVIRFKRRGRVHLPQYDIVVTDSRSGRDKKFIERLGFHHPLAKGAEVPFSLDEAALNAWIAKGAQVSDAVIRLLIKQNMGPAKLKEAFQAKKQRRIKAQDYVAKQKAAAEAKKAAKDAAPAAEAPAPEAAPAPAEAPSA